MTNSNEADFGVIGLAVMGRNLALNISDHDFRVAVWNLEQPVTEQFVAESPGQSFVGTASLAGLVSALKRPRRILMMIRAGKPVDLVLDELAPLLDAGDIVIDGGNTRYQETQRREKALSAKGIHFVGMGVSGGEEGARRGPSLMPGGTVEAWKHLQPVLESIAARTDSGPCVAHVGSDGAGHFVKMVHNGIEYGDMQLIAEAYDVLGRAAGMGATEVGDVFARWNEGPLASFLIELTGQVLHVRDEETGKPLVDLVMDKAGQKGTGQWTVESALDLGVPIPTIAAALVGRGMSSLKAERVAASELIRGVVDASPPSGRRNDIVNDVHDALLASKICSYAQGLRLIAEGAKLNGWNTSLGECARIWKGGCIIRAKLLDDIMRAYGRNAQLPNLLVDPELETMLHAAQPAWRRATNLACSLGIPVPAMSASLAYFDSYRTARLPQNITQAQRDAFGAHTYERTDRLELGFVHTEWLRK